MGRRWRERRARRVAEQRPAAIVAQVRERHGTAGEDEWGGGAAPEGASLSEPPFKFDPAYAPTMTVGERTETHEVQFELWVRVECSCGRVAAYPQGGFYPRCGNCSELMVLPGASPASEEDGETRRNLGLGMIAVAMPEREAARHATALADRSLLYPSGELERARERAEAAARRGA